VHLVGLAILIVSHVKKGCAQQHRHSYLFVGVPKQVAWCGVGRNLSFGVQKEEGTVCDPQLAAASDKFKFAPYLTVFRSDGLAC
jgi:hypothetical protein